MIVGMRVFQARGVALKNTGAVGDVHLFAALCVHSVALRFGRVAKTSMWCLLSRLLTPALGTLKCGA